MDVTALDDSPTVGKPFSLKCGITVARGIISNMDIIWTVNNTVQRNHTVNNTVWDGNPEFIDIYSIPQLQLDHDNTMCHCKVVINTHPHVESSDYVTIDNIKVGK